MAINFLTKENIDLLWDVISDEEIFKYLNSSQQITVNKIFLNNLKGFYKNQINSHHLKKINLVELNKNYILLIINFIKQNYSLATTKLKILDNNFENRENINTNEIIEFDNLSYNSTNNSLNNSIKNSNNNYIENNINLELDETYNTQLPNLNLNSLHNINQKTKTDLKLKHFEDDLARHEEDLKNYTTLKLPPIPNFENSQKDIPIKEMDMMIKEITAKRNFDTNIINNEYKFGTQVNNWLSPQNTSLRENKSNLNTNEREKLKLPLINSNSKKISWGANQEYSYYPENSSKLLKINSRENSLENNKILENQKHQENQENQQHQEHQEHQEHKENQQHQEYQEHQELLQYNNDINDSYNDVIISDEHNNLFLKFKKINNLNEIKSNEFLNSVDLDKSQSSNSNNSNSNNNNNNNNNNKNNELEQRLIFLENEIKIIKELLLS